MNEFAEEGSAEVEAGVAATGVTAAGVGATGAAAFGVASIGGGLPVLKPRNGPVGGTDDAAPGSPIN